MKVAIASTSPLEVAVLRRVVVAAGAHPTWVAGEEGAIVAKVEDEPPAVLLLALGPWDAAAVVRLLRAARTASANGAARAMRVLVVTEHPEREVHRVYAAFEAGATDVVQRPTLDDDPGRLAAKLRLTPSSPRPSRAPVLAIAASTGGPQALARVLRELPAEVRAPILLAQHIGPEFLPGLASWLGGTSGRDVVVAEEGAELAPGRVLLARSDLQPRIDARRVIHYARLDPMNPHHPCIDTLFESLAAVRELRGVAALLTGMGSDGAKGLLALRHSGWTTLAQDADSSVVFGMPRAAAALGAAARVVPLDRVAGAAAEGLASLGPEAHR